ncbi:MAG: hypothetical protein KC620_11875 [Myxococcales bacterium]|nr:hypothetical protein [Myxococcales bacterium]
MKTPSLLTIAVALMAWANAQACLPPERGVFVSATSPIDGATDVPVDQPILVVLTSHDGRLDADALADRVTLLGPEGTAVPGVVTPVEGMRFGPGLGVLRFWPDAPLARTAGHTLRVIEENPWSGEAITRDFAFATGKRSYAVGRAEVAEMPIEPFVMNFGSGCLPDEIDSCGGCLQQEVDHSVDAFEVVVVVDMADDNHGLFLTRSALGATEAEARAIRARTPSILQIANAELRLDTGHGEVPTWQSNQACASVEVRDLAGNLWLDETRCATLPEALAPPPEDEVDLPGDLEPGHGDGGGCSAAPGGAPSAKALLVLLGLCRRRRSFSR